MVFNDKPPAMLVSQPTIKTAAELRGKRFGGSTVGSLEYGWMKEMLPKFGLQPEKDVTFVPVGSTSTRCTALRAGTIDASPPSNFSPRMPVSRSFSALRTTSGYSGDDRRHRRWRGRGI